MCHILYASVCMNLHLKRLQHANNIRIFSFFYGILKASIKLCGSFLIKPTVSVNSTWPTW